MVRIAAAAAAAATATAIATAMRGQAQQVLGARLPVSAP